MHGEGLTARLLARSDGERRLTNWLHLAECLHQAAETHAAPDALLRWFDTQRERGGRVATRRSCCASKSDQNLVQIVTVHRAKGSESTPSSSARCCGMAAMAPRRARIASATASSTTTTTVTA